MVSTKQIQERLDKIGFKSRGWGRTEVRELQNIILPDEEIFECVNGIYEGGFALLLATDIRVLLVDKKPLNYLTVEDLRFDMISEIDYSHRLFGAYIAISTGNKNLKFTSLNQLRLRKLIGHVQHCMAEVKKQQSTHQEGQHQHLEQINQQLRAYLVAQYKQQEKLNEQLQRVKAQQESAASLPLKVEPIRPSPELSDYLLAQTLLADYQVQTNQAANPKPINSLAPLAVHPSDQLAELYSEGHREVFGKYGQQLTAGETSTTVPEHLKHLVGQTLRSGLGDVELKLNHVFRPHDIGFALGADLAARPGGG
jgi:hypothetical protein